MKILAETERLILREIEPEDVEGLFALDSDPEVHRYLGHQTLKTRDEAAAVIRFIRQQYVEHGIGRWAVVERESNNFLGWSGLKLVTEPMNNHTMFYDIGYRIIRNYWGRGYATESAVAALRYGFEEMKLSIIYAAAHGRNEASNHILKKLGLTFVEEFDYHDTRCNWYALERSTWRQAHPPEV